MGVKYYNLHTSSKTPSILLIHNEGISISNLRDKFTIKEALRAFVLDARRKEMHPCARIEMPRIFDGGLLGREGRY